MQVNCSAHKLLEKTSYWQFFFKAYGQEFSAVPGMWYFANNRKVLRKWLREASFRSFPDRLTYNDECSTTDSNLCDSHVGSRNERNIRQHLWFAIRTPVVRGKENVFDVFRLQECINDVCEDTLQVDKLYLLLLETPMRILHSELKLDLQKRKHKNVIMQ